jgi:hypothetical protein
MQKGTPLANAYWKLQSASPNNNYNIRMRHYFQFPQSQTAHSTDYVTIQMHMRLLEWYEFRKQKTIGRMGD